MIPSPLIFYRRIKYVFFLKTYTSVDRRVNGTLKNVFEVTDEAGSVIDTLPRLKDAKAKYAEI